LEHNYDETVISENKRTVVPEEDVADSGPMSGIFSAVTLYLYNFLMT
jgi:hypothetical protein